MPAHTLPHIPALTPGGSEAASQAKAGGRGLEWRGMGEQGGSREATTRQAHGEPAVCEILYLAFQTLK